VLATFAQFERRLIGQRTKEALAARRAEDPDLVIGRAANIPAEVVERIRAEYRAGATLAQVADGLTADGVATAQGGRKWYASTISGVLKRHGEPARRRGRRPDDAPAP